MFQFHPDLVHTVVVKTGRLLGGLPITRHVLSYFFGFSDPRLEQTLFGITFKNPVGLSGGFDKNVELTQVIPAVGFGFMEVGSITRHAYRGNKRPWNVRLPKDRSLLVNYGLKNLGVEILALRLQRARRQLPIIVNIAKTNDPTISGAGTVADYLYSYQRLEALADMVNINISCPNTGDGVLLCENLNLLSDLLVELQQVYDQSIKKSPILLKLKPDLSVAAVTNLVNLAKKFPCVKGFIIANLSKNRSLLTHSDPSEYEPYAGGISGEPIRALSTAMISTVRRLIGPEYLIVGCGGIFTAEQALEKLKAGANVVELVTGLIYEGPRVIKTINQGLVRLLAEEGLTSVAALSAQWPVQTNQLTPS